MRSREADGTQINTTTHTSSSFSGSSGGGGKAVVFSQMRAAIFHLQAVLEDEGIGCVKIAKGDSQADLASAVATWTADAQVPVLLLHASS